MDIFKKWLNKKEDNEYIKRALTDNSYKTVYAKANHKEYEGKVNTELATLGDAVIKVAYCIILLDEVEQLSVEKAKYESDKFFIEVIGKKYNILHYLDFDKEDENIFKKYLYQDPETKKYYSTKYIATAVEAVIGAIYIIRNNNIRPIVKLLRTWKALYKEEN